MELRKGRESFEGRARALGLQTISRERITGRIYPISDPNEIDNREPMRMFPKTI
jgi:hypothetical protein